MTVDLYVVQRSLNKGQTWDTVNCFPHSKSPVGLSIHDARTLKADAESADEVGGNFVPRSIFRIVRCRLSDCEEV